MVKHSLTRNTHVSGNHGDVSYAGCINIVGATIQMAIRDYQAGRRNRRNKEWMQQNRHHVDTATHYLFHPNGVETILQKYGLEFNVAYLREVANGKEIDFCQKD